MLSYLQKLLVIWNFVLVMVYFVCYCICWFIFAVVLIFPHVGLLFCSALSIGCVFHSQCASYAVVVCFAQSNGNLFISGAELLLCCFVLKLLILLAFARKSTALGNVFRY